MPDADLLVTGVSSQPGHFLLPQLDGFALRVVAVGRHRPDGLSPSIAWREADLAAPPTLPAAAAILHLAPVWLLPPLLDALPRAPQRIIALSSASVGTKAHSADTGERRLAERLITAESAVRSFADSHGSACRIVRRR
ncbi:MAG: hypothetical protein U5L11_12850 [Arhodomonas sp.]|nr:hypothetical protein [Arhodomonas sp.]